MIVQMLVCVGLCVLWVMVFKWAFKMLRIFLLAEKTGDFYRDDELERMILEENEKLMREGKKKCQC